MTGSRGPLSRPYPTHPSWVLTQAMKIGLSTAIYIQRSLTNKNTRHLYESSHNIWRRATESYYISKAIDRPDFNHIMKAEHNIRKNALDTIEEIAAAYGCTETIRSKRWYDTVGPLNQRLNAGGACLRNGSQNYYPFPQTIKLSGDNGDELKRGFSGSSRAPNYIPIHKTLPELDFMDSVRMHIQVLNNWCYIYDVPVDDTSRYSNLFILRTKPYLDYIYSEHKFGRPGFRKGTLDVLRGLKADISKHYTVRAGNVPTVTSELESTKPKVGLDFFRNQLAEAEKAGIDSVFTKELHRILTGGSIISKTEEGTPSPCLTEADATYIWQIASEKSRKIGSHVHRHITRLFPSPWSIERAILGGDSLEEDKVYRLIAEVPLKTDLGEGRADLVLLRREAAPTGLRILWRPVMVVEVKSRTAFNWEFRTEQKVSTSRTRARMEQRVVPEFLVQPRSLTKFEWKTIIESTPSDYTEKQLKAYADALSKSFSALAEIDIYPSLIQSTLVIDSYDDNENSISMIRDLVVTAFEKIEKEGLKSKRRFFEAIKGENKPKMGLIVHTDLSTSDYNGVVIPKPWNPPYDPFFVSGHRKGKFILYLSGVSPTSGGKSAAWIAKYYHGLEFMHQLLEEKPELEVVWIDLADEFDFPPIAEVRLRLRTQDEDTNQSKRLQRIFERIRFESLFRETQDSIFKEGENPDIYFHLGKTKERPQLVVVSGWDTLNDATPKPYRNRLSDLLVNIIEQIPDDENVVVLWFDSPVPDERKSAIYSAHCLLPFYSDSPLSYVVNQIIWNLPAAPVNEIWPKEWYLPVVPTAPVYDDIRIMVTVLPTSFKTELIHIPPLRGWSAKFRTEQYDDIQSESDETIEFGIPDSDMRERMKALALTLIPWIFGLWPDSAFSLEGHKIVLSDLKKQFKKHAWNAEIDIKSRKLSKHSRLDPGLLKRMKFRPSFPSGSRAYMQLSIGKINSHRYYKKAGRARTNRRPSYVPPLPEPYKQEIPKPLFGQIIRDLDSEEGRALLVIEDPKKATRVAVGLFTSASGTDSRGFQWTESDWSRHVNAIHKMLKSGSKTNLVLIPYIDGYLGWEQSAEDLAWRFHGALQFILGNVQPVGALRAVRRIADLNTEMPAPQNMQTPENLSNRAANAIEILLQLHKKSQQVTVHLNWQEEGCIADFQNAENEIIHTQQFLGTADLVKALTATRYGFPLKLESGEMMFWGHFKDIDYGDFSLITIIAESYIPSDTVLHLPHRIDEIYSLPREGPISVEVSHEENKCPIAMGLGLEHDKCWIVQVVSENEELSHVFNGNFTDREVLLMLGPQNVVAGDCIYQLMLVLPDSFQVGKGMVLRESPLILKLLATFGEKCPKLIPGTYLQAQKQKWAVNISLDKYWPTWYATSTVTGEYWKWKAFTFELDTTHELSEIINGLWNAITSEIPVSLIHESGGLRNKIQKKLELYGISKTPIEVIIELTLKGREITEWVRRASDNNVLSKNVFSIGKQESKEQIIEAAECEFEEGRLSRFSILNKSEYMQKLEELLDEIIE